MSSNRETVFIKSFRVAVALAILKNKPPLVLSIREYVRKLYDDYRKLQHEWKSKYEKARNEILVLKQKSVLNKNSLDNASGSSGITESEFLYPTPQSSLCFNQNAIFLQRILNIRHSLDSLKNKAAIKETTKDTVLQSLDVILKSIQTDKIQISMQNVEDSLRSVIELCSLWYGKEYRNINSKVLDILNSMVSKLLEVDGLNPISTGNKENLKQLIMSLTKTNHLTYYAAIMNIMMVHSGIIYEKLRLAQSDRDFINCSDYENIIYVVDIITRSLKCNQSLLSGKEGKCLCKTLQVHVDKSLLHMSDNFPLVAHSLWKISGILQKNMKDFH